MRALLLLSLTLVLANCASRTKPGSDQAGHETVVSRIDSLSSRPEWVSESEPFKIDVTLTSLGQATVPSDSRVEVAYRISDNAAKVAVASAIESKLESVFQVADEGTNVDATQIRSLSAEATRLTSNSIRIRRHYWERVSTVGENGVASLRLRVFSLAEMPTQDFKAAVVDAFRARQGKGGISAEFAKKAEKQFDRMLEQDSRKPTAQD